MIDEMDNQQLKEYIEKRPVELKMVKIQKSNHRPKVNYYIHFSIFCISNFLFTVKKTIAEVRLNSRRLKSLASVDPQFQIMELWLQCGSSTKMIKTTSV